MKAWKSWSFPARRCKRLQKGGQQADVSRLKRFVEQWIQTATQKTAGQRGRKDTSWDNLERIKMGILCEAVALVLSGELDKLEKKEEG